jgi:hypothetical protein
MLPDAPPVANARSRPGSVVEIVCSAADAGNRALHRDGMEVVYKVGNMAPATPDECRKVHISTRATAAIQLEDSDAGKRFYGFARWKYSNGKSSAWSQMVAVTIIK